MLVAGCILYRQESKNRTQMELYVVVLVPDLPLLISVSSLHVRVYARLRHIEGAMHGPD
jgi:hypothetical protein